MGCQTPEKIDNGKEMEKVEIICAKLIENEKKSKFEKTLKIQIK